MTVLYRAVVCNYLPTDSISVEQACYLVSISYKVQEEKNCWQQIILLPDDYDETFVERTP